MPVSQQNDLLIFSLFEQLSDGIIISDDGGIIVFVNDAAEKIRNIKKEKILGKSVLNCHSSEAVGKIERAIEHLKENPNLSYHRMVTDKKNERAYENSYTSIIDKSGKFIGTAVISKDITEKRNLEEKRARDFKIQEEMFQDIQLKYHKLLLTSLETLTNLLEAKDSYTHGHSKRVAEISLKMYEHMYGMTSEYFDLENAAKLHDIGKICIPDSIINKPGKLTKGEIDVIRKHSNIAAELIAPLDPAKAVTNIVLHHHERYDGTGYPEGMKGKDIPLGSRIIALADAYDAMSSNRPYRKALSYDECVGEIKKYSGKQFDPELSDVFLELLETGSI